MRHMGVPTKTMATGIRNQESGKIISEVNDHSNFLSSASINDYEDSFLQVFRTSMYQKVRVNAKCFCQWFRQKDLRQTS